MPAITTPQHAAFPAPSQNLQRELENILHQGQPAAQDLLEKLLQIPSTSGNERDLVLFIAGWAKQNGFEADLFESSETELSAYRQATLRHIPLAGRPTLVITFAGRGHGRSLMFNAHSDVIAPGDPQRWAHGPWSGKISDGRIYGRGACDVKGPLASALAALLALKNAYPQGLPGDVRVEIVPGEEDCVGLGTLTSYVRGYHPDGLIVLEPTEGQPRNASRGGVRFAIRVQGKAAHGTVKWLGIDAIIALRAVLEHLELMETEFAMPDANELFARYPLMRPITVDHIEGGNWQGATCDLAGCAGYLELLPADDVEVWKKRFQDRLCELQQKGKASGCRLEIEFSEEYGGHELSTGHPLAQCALAAITDIGLTASNMSWRGFNAGCEAGLRWGINQTPTLVWGPGSLEQAHGVDEYVELKAVHDAARSFALCAIHWTTLPVK